MGTTFFSPKPMKKSSTRVGSSGHTPSSKGGSKGTSMPKGGTTVVNK